ncbi:heme-binding protein [Phytohabitans sp. ZYX-F-186]|uniref:Heme-binding protein n=1 Tax=Phytohabitans maris TaxID=3071409 RepID=A0ABU0ZSV0_9ACTN|nr:heme-binding protein [Phytohabitans sp. ZYX-F-186]MDQ7910110.1 heme-binding protein [Phytohabitans sp. ZYX-F-186]
MAERPEPPTDVEGGPVLDFDRALEYVLRARKIGAELGLRVTVAVHDPAGHPVLVARGGDKWHGPYMAMGKARLAAAFRKPTSVLLENWRDRPMFPLSLTEVLPGGVTLNPGGYPIVEHGEFVGAIGVGGGSPDQDELVARRTVAELADTIP